MQTSVTQTMIKKETISRTNWTEPKMDKRELEYILDRGARKLRYKSKRTKDYVNRMNEILDELNSISSNILADITSHKFYNSIRNIIRDLFIDWYSSQKLTKEEIYLLRNSILLFNRLVNIINDITKLTSWLIDPSFINSLADCLSDIDRLLFDKKEKDIFKQLIRLFDMFSTYYDRLPLNLQNEHGLDRLFEATMDCLVSSNYDEAFRKLKSNAESLTREQKFFLIKCPSFISSYRGSQSNKIIEQILSTMVPRYAFLLDQHIQSINEWKSPLIHAVHHLLLTVIYAKGYYTPYATGQPLQWLIDHIIRIVSESSLTKKVNEKGSTPESILIDSALRTLAAFVHEPDLLAYIKHLKITSIFHSLILLPNESIVLHVYVMLSYILEEDDIKASEKDSGRLLSKIFDSLRKKIKSLSITNKNEETIERNISLLVESVQALVQHDQIKSEILKQNALSLLIDGYQHLSNRSKRLLLESLGSITFDEEAARLLRDNTQFIDSIKDMQKTTDDGINKAADKIIWNLIKEPEREKKPIKENIESDDKKEEEKPKKEEYQHDIMISYCHTDKELVYRIHKFLSDKGFKIWFDRDNIYGPAMQAMADAVENSEFVLLCMSDSYKRSVYCQAEAEYAFHRKRNLVPAIVRQGYRADGWLGLIIGSRMYADFGRLEFKNACDLILKEITLQRENQTHTDGTTNEHTFSKDLAHEISQNNEVLNETIEKSNLPKEYRNRNTTKSTYRSNSINQWAKKDVLDFLYDANLHYMMPLCELMTGHGLTKLFRICQTKPSRLYSQLNEELTARFDGLHLPIGIFTQFLSEMDRLVDSCSVQDIEQDALQSRSVSSSQSSQSSSSPPPPPKIVKRTSDPTSLLEPPRKPSIQLNSVAPSLPIASPSLTRIQRSHNVQITEQTDYRTEPIVTTSANYIVQSSQDPLSVHLNQIGPYGSGVTIIDEQAHPNQPINTIPYRRTSYTYGTQSVQKTNYT